ncbi:hypothetical protein P9112_014301 [Eukaryota sp. TZLM1-RC]
MSYVPLNLGSIYDHSCLSNISLPDFTVGHGDEAITDQFQLIHSHPKTALDNLFTALKRPSSIPLASTPSNIVTLSKVAINNPDILHLVIRVFDLLSQSPTTLSFCCVAPFTDFVHSVLGQGDADSCRGILNLLVNVSNNSRFAPDLKYLFERAQLEKFILTDSMKNSYDLFLKFSGNCVYHSVCQEQVFGCFELIHDDLFSLLISSACEKLLMEYFKLISLFGISKIKKIILSLNNLDQLFGLIHNSTEFVQNLVFQILGIYSLDVQLKLSIMKFSFFKDSSTVYEWGISILKSANKELVSSLLVLFCNLLEVKETRIVFKKVVEFIINRKAIWGIHPELTYICETIIELYNFKA